MNDIMVVFFSVAALLVIRAYMGLTMRLCLSKKNRKKYKKDTSLIDRWFFLSAPHVVRDKYSKPEKKVIKYTTIMKLYRVINLSLHIALLVELTFVLLSLFGWVDEEILDGVCFIYLCVFLLVLILLCTVEVVTNKRYHRSRYRR